MRPRVPIWLTLMTVHLAAGAWGWNGGPDRLASIVAGSIYLPLWPFGKLCVPVLGQSAWLFPPLTSLGWVIIVLIWVVAYWYIAGLFSYLLERRKRAA